MRKLPKQIGKKDDFLILSEEDITCLFKKMGITEQPIQWYTDGDLAELSLLAMGKVTKNFHIENIYEGKLEALKLQ